MSGFEVGGTGRILTFDGTPYAGLEVKVDEAPLGLLLDIMEDFTRLTGDELDVKAAARAMKALIANFAGVLEEWNVTRNGEPVPATLDGLRSLGSVFVLDVVRAWLTEKVTAGEELGKDSVSGATSAAEREAMAALSRSLPS